MFLAKKIFLIHAFNYEYIAKVKKYRPISQTRIVMVLVLFVFYILITVKWTVVGGEIYYIILYNNRVILSRKHIKFGFILTRVQISVHSLSSFKNRWENTCINWIQCVLVVLCQTCATLVYIDSFIHWVKWYIWKLILQEKYVCTCASYCSGMYILFECLLLKIN